MSYKYSIHYYSSVINRLLLIVVLAITQTSLAASIDYLDKNDGLSHSGVNTIFQDSDGIVWVGTETAVNWYLGDRFKKFQKLQNSKKS